MYTRIENIKSKTDTFVAFRDLLDAEQSKMFTYLVEEKLLRTSLFYERSKSKDVEIVNFSIWESRKAYETAKLDLETELKNNNFIMTPDEYYANPDTFIITLDETCDDDE